MINARVTAVVTPATGKSTFAFVQAGPLVSRENPNGEAMFRVQAPHWTDGRPPRRGQTVVLGSVERIQLPHWDHPKWRATDVSPAWAVKKYSPARYVSPSKVTRAESPSVWARLAAFLGFSTRSAANRPQLKQAA